MGELWRHSVGRSGGQRDYGDFFLPHLASYTHPIKDLLSEKNEWCWGFPQTETFQKLKAELSSSSFGLILTGSRDICHCRGLLLCLGGVLSQKQSDGTWKPVFISRGLSEAEKHYAQMEKEALAVTWASERLSSYLLGLKYRLETDHKPLLSLLSTKALDDLPPQILRFRLSLMKFTFDIVQVPGKQLITVDMLSRAPVKHIYAEGGRG